MNKKNYVEAKAKKKYIIYNTDLIINQTNTKLPNQNSSACPASSCPSVNNHRQSTR